MTNKKVMILPSIRTVRQEIEETDEPVIKLAAIFAPGPFGKEFFYITIWGIY